ncbi:proteophosphoglycan precursor [alpha proteobacterium U9-1i]|nr:proteophosphoglycan precursor [alpha proteobacterium U9-1i]
MSSQENNGLEQLLSALKSQGGTAGITNDRGPPPVDKWNPTYCGEAGFEILRDGTWKHEGARITRESLVRLFASILRKDEDGQTYLVTPVEKIRVDVADAHFLAVRVDKHGWGRDQTLVFTTNVGDVVTAGPANPIRVTIDPESDEPRPYVLVRGRLEARILRAPYYELADWAEFEAGRLGVWSGGAFFPIGA